MKKTSNLNPPEHIILQILATLTIITGVTLCMIACISDFFDSIYMQLLTVIGGAVIIVFGYSLFCLRNVMIDLWHIRHRQ